MLDFFDLPQGTHADVQQFGANTTAASASWHQWVKRRGVSMVYIVLCGAGGNGGNGAVGAVSTAAGGGGGATGCIFTLLVPAVFLPDVLFLSIPYGGVGSAFSAGIVFQPTATPLSSAPVAFLSAQCGDNATNASGATAGVGGALGSTAIISPTLGLNTTASGTNGVTGGTTGAGASLTAALTAYVLSGIGGAGLGASGSAGSAGGGYNANGAFAAIPGGLGASSASTPAGAGRHGTLRSSGFGNLMRAYGGCGGGSSNGSATGAGLVGGNGGDGIMGSGGGGGGGCLTGGVAGKGGRGGDGWAVIISW